MMRRRDFFHLTTTFALGAIVGCSRAFAQDSYPTGPIRLIVPFPPGGVVDICARYWADRAKAKLGTVVVDNIAGAGGIVGANNAARSNPDGLTLLFGDSSVLAIAPALLAQPPYDPSKDLVPIAMVAHSASTIAVHPSVPAKTLEEFISYVRSNQEKVTYASAGYGTVTHLAGESFKQAIGTPKVLHVPYRGMGPALVDLMAGVVPMATPNVTQQILDLYRSGKIRILAICSPHRISAAPEIPTASEVLPGFVMQLTCGVVAPVGVPEPILSKIASVTEETSKDPSFRRLIEESGLEVSTVLTPRAAADFWRSEREHLLPIIKSAGLQPQ
ncbi:MAG: tripartite tricarboxylate transporter substrate binding protein [Xanthobacteraceae bacterium]